MSQEFLPTGLRAYLQYCKCCIYCFAIQLLSEPDKLNWCSLFQVGFRHATFLAFSGLIPSLIVLAQYSKQYSQYSKLSVSNYSIMRCICKMRDALVKEKNTTWQTWLSLDFNILVSCFLFTTEKAEIEQNFQIQRKDIKHFCLRHCSYLFVKGIYWNQIMNACFDIFLLYCFKKLYLEQFEAKVYVSFQHVVHVYM